MTLFCGSSTAWDKLFRSLPPLKDVLQPRRQQFTAHKFTTLVVILGRPAPGTSLPTVQDRPRGYLIPWGCSPSTPAPASPRGLRSRIGIKGAVRPDGALGEHPRPVRRATRPLVLFQPSTAPSAPGTAHCCRSACRPARSITALVSRGSVADLERVGRRSGKPGHEQRS